MGARVRRSSDSETVRCENEDRDSRPYLDDEGMVHLGHDRLLVRDGFSLGSADICK